MEPAMNILFWGTRGLVSSPKSDKITYGGNTPCVQILYKNHLILVDTGFGATNLGEPLMQRILKNKEKLEVHIFYTHFHWDHIQGLPFFHPIYFKSTKLFLYSPEPSTYMASNLDILFDGSYSPFSGLANMPSQISLQQLTAPVEIDGLKVEYARVDHAVNAATVREQQAFAYKFTDPSGASVVIASDHEARPSPLNRHLIDFAQGCSLLIHDAQFTDAEYRKRAGWGHSTAGQALDNGLKTRAGRVLMTHHAPARTDAEIQKIFEKLRRMSKYARLNFEFAREDVLYPVVPVVLSQLPKPIRRSRASASKVVSKKAKPTSARKVKPKSKSKPKPRVVKKKVTSAKRKPTRKA